MQRKIVVLDVREMLRAHEEPFQKIMETVGELGEGELLQLHATFKPDPLLRVLGKQGFKSSVYNPESEHFITQFYKSDSEVPTYHLDNRGLQPPQPMMNTLEMLDNVPELKAGEMHLEIWNDRVPALLFPELADLQFDYEVAEQPEGYAVVRIFKG